MITIQAAKPIQLKLPTLYRYMQEEFVDLFFDTGRLRIGSFARFRVYPDEVRGDVQEGHGAVSGKGQAGFHLVLIDPTGVNGYVLSTSLVHSEALESAFRCNSGFAIVDPLGFAAAVMNNIPGTNESFMGYCNYQEVRVIEKENQNISVKDFSNEQGNFLIGAQNLGRAHKELVGNGIDLMFLKGLTYQYQAEFRFVWTVNTAFTSIADYIDIDCKEAVQHCRRLSKRSVLGGE